LYLHAAYFGPVTGHISTNYATDSSSGFTFRERTDTHKWRQTNFTYVTDHCNHGLAITTSGTAQHTDRQTHRPRYVKTSVTTA